MLIDNSTVKVSGNIDKALDKIFKLQFAFERAVAREELPFECVHYESSGRVITAVVRGDKNEIMKMLSDMNPVLLEEIPIDFEDMFIEEVRERGYLK